VRLVAATNRDLSELAETGRFRADLYYRINTVSLVLPPLRARPDDIPLLAAHFVARACTRFKRPVLGIAPEVQRRLLEYRWPGNVRELEHALDRAALVARDDIRLEDLPPELHGGTPAVAVAEGSTMPPATLAPFREAREEFERSYLRAVLDAAGGNVTEAAERAGLHRATLYEKLSRLGIKVP
jgi:DNA-binding NtrC family response regulator